jgi:hypothetical protein
MNEDMKNLNIPTLYERLSKNRALNIFSQRWEGDKTFEKCVLRWLFIHYPSEFIKHVPNIPICGDWGDVYDLLFDLSEYKTLQNEFSRSFTAGDIEKYREVQKEIINFIIWRIKLDYTLMTLGAECSDCVEYGRNPIFKTLSDMMNIRIGDFRKNYITPLKAYTALLRNDYKNWVKVPHSAIRRYCSL